MTEEEAKTTQCCGPDGCGRFNDNPYSARWCVASVCMAWRWADKIERSWTSDAPKGDGWNRVEAIGGVAHWVRIIRTLNGYCGLAGEPK